MQLTEQEIRQLCMTAKEIFMSQPNLLELEAPIKICGAFRSVLVCRPGDPLTCRTAGTVFTTPVQTLKGSSHLQATFMASIRICCGSLNTAAFHQRPTTCSWGIT